MDLEYKRIVGNCFEVLPTFRDKRFDFVLTSPPFKDKDVPYEYYKWLNDVLELLRRVTKHYIIMFNSSTRLIQICKYFSPERILIWYKGIMKYAYRYEPIFLFNCDTDLKINKRIWSDTFKFLSLHSFEGYKNPVTLYMAILRMVARPGDYILDPFCGHGTTLQAGKKLGMNVFGIDLKLF